MVAPIQLIPGALSELFAQASHSGQLSLADRYGLLAAILDESLTEEERCVLDRLLHAVNRGKLNLIEDLSTLS
jgi:hypothetical protein